MLTGEYDRRHELGRVAGWPKLKQGDPLAHLARGTEEGWTLLFQTDFGGVLISVALPTADLAAGRFDRAEATADHD